MQRLDVLLVRLGLIAQPGRRPEAIERLRVDARPFRRLRGADRGLSPRSQAPAHERPQHIALVTADPGELVRRDAAAGDEANQTGPLDVLLGDRVAVAQ